MSTNDVTDHPDGTSTPSHARRLQADGLALACHEARHVRVLTKARYPPRDSVDAW